jgi:bifunctional UDP-N-acetylglucosamine pyrophosphorylase/glucosamine-1-phosphate N-acetyltransferase
MKSATPKVLHRICGRSLLGHVMGAAASLDSEQTLVVVGHGREQVVSHLAETAPGAVAIVQEEQLGTGHAVRLALDALPTVDGTVVVLVGDTPLLSGETLDDLVAVHQARAAAATVLTADLDDPAGYGRVVRDETGQVAAIVEHKDADAQTREVREVNSGMYAFDGNWLREALDKLTTDNVQQEEYLPDVLALIRDSGGKVSAVRAHDPTEIVGVNDRVQLAAARRLLRDRLLERWMRAGVTVIDPSTTWLGVDVELQPDVVIHQNVQLHGRTIVRRGAEVGPDSTLRDTVVGEGARVVRAQCDSAEIGPGATVGPFAYLRPGTRLGANGRIGTYVETKNADIGEGSKVPHLTYVGDATIGEHTNIGAATVFVNYDGVNKHRTVVGSHARTGADNMFVAPVEIGDGAYTAAGSVITDDVPPGAMGIGRARQRNVEGWVERRRPGTPAAQAAANAVTPAEQQEQDETGDGEG